MVRVFMCRLFITATELEEWCRLYNTAQASTPRVVHVVQRCTGMSVSLVGFGHEGWFLRQAVQLWRARLYSTVGHSIL